MDHLDRRRQEIDQSSKHVVAKVFTRIQSVSHVDVPSVCSVSHKGGRPTCHVGCKNWSWLAKSDRPPSPSFGSNVNLRKAKFPGFFKESIHELAILPAELVQFHRQINDPPKRRSVR